jgi:hypothetical protein
MKALRSHSLRQDLWQPIFLTLFLAACGMAPETGPADPSANLGNRGSSTPTESTGPTTHTEIVENVPINQVIVECERHIRSWQVASSNRRNDPTGETIQALEAAFDMYVTRHMDALTETAISGPDRPRGIASTALGFSGDPTVKSILMNNLSDSSDLVVANTLFGLAMLGDPDIPVIQLEAAMRRPSASLGLLRNAAFALVQLAEIRRSAEPPMPISDDWVRLMQYLLHRPEPEIRAQGASGLGYLGAASAVPQLANLLAGDPESRVRFAAAFALGEIGDRTAVEDLLGALYDPDSMTAGAARAALTKILGQDMGANPESWQAILPSDG